jgi:hypothetical protein
MGKIYGPNVFMKSMNGETCEFDTRWRRSCKISPHRTPIQRSILPQRTAEDSKCHEHCFEATPRLACQRRSRQVQRRERIALRHALLSLGAPCLAGRAVRFESGACCFHRCPQRILACMRTFRFRLVRSQLCFRTRSCLVAPRLLRLALCGQSLSFSTRSRRGVRARQRLRVSRAQVEQSNRDERNRHYTD